MVEKYDWHCPSKKYNKISLNSGVSIFLHISINDLNFFNLSISKFMKLFMHSWATSSSDFFPFFAGTSGFISLSVSDKNIFDLIKSNLFWKKWVNNLILTSSL